MPHRLLTLISGAQTGVDRGALDAALDAGFPCGGWCPEGRLAEDGTIPDRYPVRELPGAGYKQRTRQNVIDSDGTLILYFGEITGGTLKTLQLCRHLSKPVLTIDAHLHDADAAARQALDFINHHSIATLNVAGPRLSGAPRAHEYAYGCIARLIELQP